MEHMTVVDTYPQPVQPAEQSRTERSLPTPRLSSQVARPRVVVVSCDGEMSQLLRDILGDDYDVTAVAEPTSMVGIDAADPDVLLVGLSIGGGLTSDEIVALAARHMRLRTVPVVLLSTDPNLLQHAGRLSHSAGVTLLSLPFDLETVLSAFGAAVQRAQPGAGRLPAVCRHGFDVVGDRCPRCG